MVLTKDKYKVFFQEYKKTPKYKENLDAKNEKYKNNPEFKEYMKAKSKERYHAKKALLKELQNKQHEQIPTSNPVDIQI